MNEEILNKLLETSNNNIISLELVTARLLAVENNLAQIRKTVYGNGDPGLTEKLRILEKELEDTCEELNKIKENFKKNLSNPHEYEDRIIKLEEKMKLIYWVLTAIGTIIIGIIGKLAWGFISTYGVAALILLI